MFCAEDNLDRAQIRDFHRGAVSVNAAIPQIAEHPVNAVFSEYGNGGANRHAQYPIEGDLTELEFKIAPEINELSVKNFSHPDLPTRKPDCQADFLSVFQRVNAVLTLHPLNQRRAVRGRVH